MLVSEEEKKPERIKITTSAKNNVPKDNSSKAKNLNESDLRSIGCGGGSVNCAVLYLSHASLHKWGYFSIFGANVKASEKNSSSGK